MIKQDALDIAEYAIQQSKPDLAVKKALSNITLSSGKLIVIAIGKAAWLMAKSASETLSKKIDYGFILTKYGHSSGPISGFKIMEASHPVVDENGLKATQIILDHTKELTDQDDVIFLLSGGGSALFEKPIIPLQQLQHITDRLLACGADIIEINTIRKRLSSVKGGKFAKWCSPAHIHNYILSDVISNDLDMIASGPTVTDHSISLQAKIINDKYQLGIDNDIISQEIPSQLDNVDSTLIGSASLLCQAAFKKAMDLGYAASIINDHVMDNDLIFAHKLCLQAERYQSSNSSIAFIYGGETTVQLSGNGLGGRNQETALSCIKKFANFKDTAILSIGSDGTDGPTDAAGGYCDEKSLQKCIDQNLDVDSFLANNDSYHLLKQIGDLIITGPTNTNVNDLIILLIQR